MSHVQKNTPPKGIGDVDIVDGLIQQRMVQKNTPPKGIGDYGQFPHPSARRPRSEEHPAERHW